MTSKRFQATGTHFHTSVYRRQPARAIAMRIDSRHSFRHSSEGWNPEGWGWGNVARSKTSRGEGLVPRSRHTGNHP